MTESDNTPKPDDTTASDVELSSSQDPFERPADLFPKKAGDSGVIPIPTLSSSSSSSPSSFDDVFARANAKLAQKQAPAADEDPFAKAAAILGKGAAPAASSGDARYLVSKDGLDFGPYTKEQVIEQLHNDEIDENTMILDRKTQERVAMRSISVFAKPIRDYIPVREERRRIQAEQREALVATAKTAGTRFVVLGVIGALVLGAGFLYWWYFIRAKPLPLDQEVLFTDLSAQFKMVPPPKEFDKVSVDNDLMAAIFSEEDPAAKAAKGGRGGRGRGKGRAGRRGRGAGGRAGGAGGGGSDENISTLDMTSDGGPSTKHILTGADINATIRSNMGGIRGCILQERKRNPSFKGVSVQFFVRPTGTTGGVKIVEGKYASGPLARCLKPRFQGMRFPRHSGLNKGVVFPFYLR